MLFRIFALISCLLLFPAVAVAEQVPQTAQQVQLSFAPIVRKTASSVVNIYAKRVVRGQNFNPFFNDPFFGQFGLNMFGAPRQRVENSLGSGVVVDASGLIATNTHVVKGASEIIVVTNDGRELESELLLNDDKTDLAILRLKDKKELLVPLTLGNSDALQVGDLVLAIGNPFGVGQTVTSGIVSALARTGLGKTDYGYYIQTDAAINPGNSGGALVDIQGRLVGINSMILAKDGGSLGIGFAIPVNMVQAVLRAALAGGKRVVRPWTGFKGQTVTQDMVATLGLKRAQGTLVNSVSPGGPAAKAGLRQGDVVLSVDGYDVADPEALKYRLATLEMGKPVKLAVISRGKLKVIDMMTEAPPENPPADRTTVAGRNPVSGATVANISPAIAEELGGTAVEEGVVVTEVTQGNAARIGLQPGDIILGVNNEKITSVKQLLGELQTSLERRWLLQVQRGREVMNLMVQI